MNRTIRIAAIVLAVLVLIALTFIWYFDPTGIFRPSDKTLTLYFKNNQATFIGLRDLALADEGKAGSVSLAYMQEAGLSQPRQVAYIHLLSKLRRCAEIGIDEFEVRFICSSGGFGPIGREWVKGIAYLPKGISRVGVVVRSLDPITEQGETFLRPIGDGWYLFYEDTD